MRSQSIRASPSSGTTYISQARDSTVNYIHLSTDISEIEQAILAQNQGVLSKEHVLIAKSLKKKERGKPRPQQEAHVSGHKGMFEKDLNLKHKKPYKQSKSFITASIFFQTAILKHLFYTNKFSLSNFMCPMVFSVCNFEFLKNFLLYTVKKIWQMKFVKENFFVLKRIK